MSSSPEYHVWHDMIKRCTDETADNYDRYGGRGIKVCSRWIGSFADFLADMGPRPMGVKYQWSLERKDNSRGYEPGNCVWAELKAQNNNRRNNRRIDFNGQSRTLVQWARSIGISVNALKERIAIHGEQAALDFPKVEAERLSYNGETLTVSEWASRIGISDSVLRKRIKKHGSDKALSLPRQKIGRPKRAR